MRGSLLLAASEVQKFHDGTAVFAVRTSLACADIGRIIRLLGGREGDDQRLPTSGCSVCEIGNFERSCRFMSAGCPEFHQAVVAEFMEQGYFIRHLKKMRALYAERRQFLAGALREIFGDGIAIISPAAGLHLVVQIKGSERLYGKIGALAHAKGLGLQPLSSWHMGSPSVDGLLLSFTNVVSRQAAQSLAIRLKTICAAAGEA